MISTLKDIIRFDFCRFQQQNQNLADLSNCGYKIMDLGKMHGIPVCFLGTTQKPMQLGI